MSLKQIEANRRNAQNSTGPKTPDGRAISKMNALKHGIRSHEVVIHGKCIRESNQEFAALHQRLWDELKPVGVLEEILADQIVTTHWRLRRALKAESGEIALSVDSGNWKRSRPDLRLTIAQWVSIGDPAESMKDSALGNQFLESQLQRVRASIEKEGELTEAPIQSVKFQGKPYGLTKDLEKLRSKLQQNPEGLEPSALREKQKEKALACIDRKLSLVLSNKSDCEKHEKMKEEATQAAEALPSPDVLDKIMRYVTALERHLFRTMDQLERLQRRRQGENVPPPQAMKISASV